MSAKEINKILEFNNAISNLQKLYKQNLVDRKEKGGSRYDRRTHIFKIK